METARARPAQLIKLKDSMPGYHDGWSFVRYPEVDAYCPIDGNQLFDLSHYDGDRWVSHQFKCFACDADYWKKSTDPEVLKQEAIRHLRKVEARIAALKQKINPLEEILGAARQNGLLINQT